MDSYNGNFSFIRGLIYLAFIFLLIVSACYASSKQRIEQDINNVIITLDPATTYQTITGWEAAGWLAQFDTPYQIKNVHKWRETVAKLSVDEIGVNRVRLEIHSGAENPVDYFTRYINGQITRKELKRRLYQIINDNSDPSKVKSEGFQFSKLDYGVDNVVLPLKTQVEANGEKLFINLNYVDFGSSSFEHTNNLEEYAEFMLATFQHLDSKYGWVPDAIEVILEPDNTANWTGKSIGNAIVATARRLAVDGYTPFFIVPSTTSMANASTYFDRIVKVPGALTYVSELSYHRYTGVSTANLKKITDRAVQHGVNTSMLEWWNSSNTYHTLHEDLKAGNNSAWQKGGLAGIPEGIPEYDFTELYRIDISDPDNPKVTINDGAKFIRQYFKFIRSGAVRIEAATTNNNFDPLAFINADGKYVVVVKADEGGAFSIKGLKTGRYGIKYTTSAQYDVDLPDVAINAGQTVRTNIPAGGVITVYARQ